MPLTATTLYSLPLILIWLVLFVRVSATRAQYNQSFGDGGHADLLQKIRQHGNFIEWVPFVLLLMLLAEAQGTSAIWLHIAGALLVLGRLVHPFGLPPGNAAHPLRYLGNGSNFLAVAVLVVCLVLILLGRPA
ncbi:eicosanoid and glutathione metabolism membrane protein [Devosia riboflavina]|uniref:Eicosanoid and glutathione metabolism membrane protein n=1 Tax=Devosia riboflavina TaxID=46914 RepID=A0A087LZL5_9HYPH|nr:MAPEG family protein [Devosia riboflavina]KFL30068.1 eicosanoid and glutathione metabolism membrane protein [Devosia riboflavina]